MGMLLGLSGASSAGTYPITCENGIATKEDGNTYTVKQANLSSDDEKSVLKVNQTKISDLALY